MNQLVEIDTKESDEKSSKALTWANNLVIKTVEHYQKADQFCKSLFQLRKDIEGDFAESERKADEAKRAATAAKAAVVSQKESHTKPVQDAERLIKTKMLAWSKEQDELRRKEQDRLRAEATKRAEDEKIKKAESLQAQGKPQAALAELDKPVKVAPIVAPAAPVARETKITEYWSSEVVDDSGVKREFCKPDLGAIQKAMNLYKGQGKTIEEVEAIIGGIRIEAKAK